MSLGVVGTLCDPSIEKSLNRRESVRQRAKDSINRVLECTNDGIVELILPVFVEEPVDGVAFALKPRIKLRVFEFAEYHGEIEKVVTMFDR